MKQKANQYAKAKPTAPIVQTEATKRSSSDFGRASTAAAKIRKAFQLVNDFYGDDTLINRFNSHVLVVFNTIPSEFAGRKELLQGNPAPLHGFQFNSVVKLEALVKRPPLMRVFPEGQFEIEIHSGKHTSVCTTLRQAVGAAMQLHVYNMDLIGDDHEIIPINELSIPFDKEFGGATLKIPLHLTGHRLLLVGLGIHYSSRTGIIGSKRARAASIICAIQIKNGEVIHFTPPEKEETLITPTVKGLDWSLK